MVKSTLAAVAAVFALSAFSSAALAAKGDPHVLLTTSAGNTRGTNSMARTADKDSATSQFFINVADNAFLDHGQRDFGYAVFGKVVKGMDVADKISQVPTHDVGPYQNVPSKPVVILSAKVLP